MWISQKQILQTASCMTMTIRWTVSDGRGTEHEQIEIHWQINIVNTCNVNSDLFYLFIIKQTTSNKFITHNHKYTNIHRNEILSTY